MRSLTRTLTGAPTALQFKIAETMLRSRLCASASSVRSGKVMHKLQASFATHRVIWNSGGLRPGVFGAFVHLHLLDDC